MKRFHDSIRRPGEMTKRQTVLSLMRIAGYENDSAKFTRLLVENPISRSAAEDAWRQGRDKREAERRPCDGCKRPDGAVNHVRGHVFVGWGTGWQPCPRCGGSGEAREEAAP